MEEFESKKFLNDTYVKRFTLIEFEKIDVPNRNI
jgi:hypothetical protein